MVTKFAIDIGGVLTKHMTDDQRKNPDSKFEEIPGAIDGVANLVTHFGAENIFINSSCKQRMQELSLEWLDNIDFYTRTGMKRENVHFVEKRENKYTIWEMYGITHMIDDRVDVIADCVKHGVCALWFMNNLFSFQCDDECIWQLVSDSKSDRRTFRKAACTIVNTNPDFPQRSNDRVIMVNSWDEITMHMLVD